MFYQKTTKKYILASMLCVVALLFGTEAYADVANNHAFDVKNNPALLCDQAIRVAGIPIEGVSGWPVKRIDFLPEATDAQKAQAWDIANNFDYPKALAMATSADGLVTSYGSGAPKLTVDGQISVAQVNGFPYIYFQANGVTQHILGASSFEISAHETTDALSGEKMQVGDFVIGMIDQNLQNGKTADDSSLHGIWVKWSSVKKELIKELQAGAGLSASGAVASGDISGVESIGFISGVKNALTGLGIAIKDGLVHIANLTTNSFFAKTARVEKLEMVDKSTGDIYCTWVENGEWYKEKGACDTQTQTAPVVNSVPDPVPTQVAEPLPQASESAPDIVVPDLPSDPQIVPADNPPVSPEPLPEPLPEPIPQPPVSE